MLRATRARIVGKPKERMIIMIIIIIIIIILIILIIIIIIIIIINVRQIRASPQRPPWGQKKVAVMAR